MKVDDLVAKLATAVAICGATLAPVAASHAQAPTDQGAAGTPAAADTGQLQEVVVTAERRDVSLQQTPIAITAVSGQAILENHLVDVNSLQSVTPAFSVNDQGGYFQSVNIRGIGNTALSPAITTGVAVFRDGLLQAETIGQEFPLFDIADTEVLEGPQGTLVGASSTAGAVQINSVNPNFRGLNGFIDTTLGNYSDKKVTGAVNLPVTDTLALRVAFNQEYRGSFYRAEGAAIQGPGSVDPINDPGHVDNSNLRIGALWKPTDTFQALFKYEFNRSDTGGEPAEPITGTYTSLFSGCPPAGATGTVVCAGPPVPNQHASFYYLGEQPFVLDYGSTDTEQVSTNQRFNLELRDTLPDGIVVRSQSGVQQFGFHHIAWNSYGPYNDGTEWHELRNDQYFSEELNVISPTTGKLNWIAGAFAFYRNTPVELANQIYTPPFQLPISPATPSQYANSPFAELLGTVNGVARTAAIFAQVGYHLTDTLELQVGARENWDDNFNQQDPTDGVYHYPNVPPNQLPATVISSSNCVTAPPSSTTNSKIGCWYNGGRFTDSVPTGKVNLAWTPVPGQNFYAFYARGYKSGGANGNNTASDPYPHFTPEHVNDWELGWKGRLLDNHIQTQLGLYYMNYQSMQYPVYDIYSPSQATLVENLGNSTVDGVEFAAQSRFGHAGIDLGFSYNHSKLGAVTALNNAYLPGNTAYNFNQASGPPQCTAGGTTTCFNYLPYQQTLSGESIPFSPKITANLAVDYGFQIGDNTLRPRVTYNHSDGQYASIFEDAYSYIGSRDLIGANLDFEMGQWLFEAYGTNLTNRLYISGKTATVQYYGAPRQFGFRMNRSF